MQTDDLLSEEFPTDAVVILAAESLDHVGAAPAMAIYRRVLGKPVWKLRELLATPARVRVELAREIRKQHPTLPTKYAVAQDRGAAIDYATRKFGPKIALKAVRYSDPQETLNQAEQFRRQRHGRES